MEHAAAAIGFEVARRVGLRVAVDWIPEGPTKHDPDGYADILELELALADHHSYLDVARAWQLLFR